MSKHGKSTANPRTENKRTRIQSWMMQEGWKIGELQNPGAVWIITGTNDAGIVVVVAQPNSIPDRIVIESSVIFDQSHQNLIAAMDGKKRVSMWWNVRLGLLSMGVEFGGITDPVEMVQLSQFVYDDALTKDRFLQRVGQVKRAQLFVLWSLARALEQPPDDEVLGSGFVQ